MLKGSPSGGVTGSPFATLHTRAGSIVPSVSNSSPSGLNDTKPVSGTISEGGELVRVAPVAASHTLISLLSNSLPIVATRRLSGLKATAAQAYPVVLPG